MIAIEVDNAQSEIELDLERLRAVSEETLRAEGVVSADVSIAIIDGETMRRLNREHLSHDYDTDVLSFLFDSTEPAGEKGDTLRGQGKSIDGEVLISAATAARVAAEFAWSVENEVILYLVHGLLHLVGYDDLTEDEKSLMRQRERVHLARWGLTPIYSDVAVMDDLARDHHSASSDPSSSVRG